MSSTPQLNVHPDGLLPSEPGVRTTAHLVAVHRLNEDELIEVMHDLVVTNPRRASKL